ncbi:MAG: efflux RND transporter periplasmic adaptor subunit [bacterium]|nr:efflux RND transporter periplasmic adaptor subunit [bacterium]
MKKALLVTVVLLALAGMVTASIFKDKRSERGVKVYAEEAGRRDITQVVKAGGQIDPRIKVNLSAHVIAKIERMYVEEGDEVVAGQPVLELEREAFVAAHDRAAAQLQIARTQGRQAEIDLRDAEIKRERHRRLAAEGVVASEQLESAELRYDSGVLAGDRAREEIRRWQAELEKARDDLEKVTLYAPLAGRVIALNAEEGEVVVSGTMNNPASVIGTIADLSEILAEVDVDETEVVHVRIGQQAKIEVDALRDIEYRGEVVEIGSSGYNRQQQPDVTFFKVKVLLADPDERLRPGMSARAEIEVATHPQAVVLPIQAVIYRPPLDEDGDELDEDADEIRVAFVIEDGKVVQRPVEVGISDATEVEIVSGVAEGETVVTGPYRRLKDLDHDDAVRREEKKDKDGKKGKKDTKDDDSGEEG